MKKLFRKIYNAITLKDLEEEINCLEDSIKDLQRSTEDQTLILEKLEKVASRFFDSDLES